MNSQTLKHCILVIDETTLTWAAAPTLLGAKRKLKQLGGKVGRKTSILFAPEGSFMNAVGQVCYPKNTFTPVEI